jgi:hypothetical protein
MKFSHLALSLNLILVSACSQAEPPATANKAVAASATSAKVEEAIRASLKQAIPDAKLPPLNPVWQVYMRLKPKVMVRHI